MNATSVGDGLHLVDALFGLAKRHLLLGSLKALLLAGEEGVHGSVELRASLEEVELHHEKETDEVTAELADKRAGCGRGSTWKLIVSLLPEACHPDKS